MPEAVLPFDQVYEFAPKANNVAVSPKQIVVVPEMLNKGSGFTTRLTTELVLHPAVLVAEMLNEPVDAGVRTIDGLITDPFQVYEFAPVALQVTPEPKQTSVFPVKDKVGCWNTVTEKILLTESFRHDGFVFVPIAVYGAELTGAMIMLEVVALLFQR